MVSRRTRSRPHAIDPEIALAETESFWREWNAQCTFELPSGVARRAAALAHGAEGADVCADRRHRRRADDVAAGADRRRAQLGLPLLLAARRDAHAARAAARASYVEEAREWRKWLLRAVAGDPADLQIMYGVAGERRLTEFELPWLPGYEGSAPVRIGNAASEQLQLDVYGEVMDALYQARAHGLAKEPHAWALQQTLLEHLERAWREPDEGIWEIRGERRHFVHSKVMAWVAFDRAVRTVEEQGSTARSTGGASCATQIHAEVCERGFDDELGSFVQSYGSKELDASLLLIPLVGFLPATDPRVRGTIEAIERELLRGRARAALPHARRRRRRPAAPARASSCRARSGSSTATSCSAATTRRTRSSSGSSALANDVGLLAEEYDPEAKRLLGNFPQAFTHLALVNSAFNVLPHLPSPMHRRHAHPSSPVPEVVRGRAASRARRRRR